MTEILFVEWIDSSLQNVQVGRFDYPKPELIRSVGWLVEETPGFVTLARDDHEDDQFRGLLCIPTECIRVRRSVV